MPRNIGSGQAHLDIKQLGPLLEELEVSILTDIMDSITIQAGGSGPVHSGFDHHNEIDPR